MSSRRCNKVGIRDDQESPSHPPSPAHSSIMTSIFLVVQENFHLKEGVDARQILMMVVLLGRVRSESK